MTGLASAPVAPATNARRRESNAVDRLRIFARVLLAAMVLATAGCAGTNVKASYHPAFLPVKLEWANGEVKLAGETSLVTPIGVFSIGAEYSLPDKEADSLYVIIRDGLGSADHPEIAGFDHIYKVKSGSGQFTAVVNGTAVIQVVDRQVLIDVTDGSVQTIEFKGAQPVVQERGSTIGDRWQAYWDGSFYSPMALSRWAYDDSTMTSWFGLGFLWFLVRLALAIVLGLVDLLLTVGCTMAAAAFVLFGPTGRNIAYGVEALTFLICAWIAWAYFRL
ncbi:MULTISPECIES: hypothetical protein [unclassified Nonomuraea]|uniref:hypothetical protein n=1 Tax=unclassified Nonomuraea TaxID=2593643 RepID=UPI0035C23654